MEVQALESVLPETYAELADINDSNLTEQDMQDIINALDPEIVAFLQRSLSPDMIKQLSQVGSWDDVVTVMQDLTPEQQEEFHMLTSNLTEEQRDALQRLYASSQDDQAMMFANAKFANPQTDI